MRSAEKVKAAVLSFRYWELTVSFAIVDGVPVCGLPGCVMYAKRTIFDLLLPRLLADDPITAEDIARLGEGGLCLGCAECHWPNCGFGHC